MWVYIDRIKNKLIRYYRKKVFLSQIKSKNAKNCVVRGNIDMMASNVKVGNNVNIYSNVVFWGDGEIVIGNNVDIGYGTIIFSSKNGGVFIGNDVAIAAHCYIIDSDHGIKRNDLIRNQDLVSERIIIGNDVWIADNCTVLKGSVIGDGAVIGAKSLVNKEIDAYGIAIGIPAKVIKYRQ